MRKLIIPAIIVFTIVLNAQPSFEFGQNYQIISVNNVNQKFPYAAFDSNGTLHLAWVHQSGSNLNVYYAQSGHVHDVSDGTTVHFENRYHTHICTETFTSHKFTPEIQYYEGCNWAVQKRNWKERYQFS